MRVPILVTFLLMFFTALSQPKKPARLPVCWTLDKKESQFDTIRSRGLIDNFLLWDAGKVIYVAFTGNSSNKLQDLVMNYAKTWEQYANIRFEKSNDTSSSDVRVSLGDEANYTFLGTLALSIPAGEPTMWIDTFYTKDPKQFRATVIHEFGHVLGLMHEHQHPVSNIKWNKEEIYKNIPYCVWGGDNTEEDYWREFLSQPHTFYTNGTAYDSKSIMHYAIPAKLTLDGYSTSWNYDLSQGDKEIISRFYPKSGSASDSNEVFRVEANVSKIGIQDKPGQGYLIRSQTSIQPKKEGEIYFAVVFYDSLGYGIDDDDEKYNVSGTVAAVEKIQLLPGKPLSQIEILLPYDQLKLPTGSRKVQMVARIYHYSEQADQFRLLYYSQPMNANIPAVKVKPVAKSLSRAPSQTVARSLRIPAVQQRTLVWCWLAVGEMLFRYYNVPAVNRYDYQCGIIGLIYAPCYSSCAARQCIIPAGSNYGMVNMLRQYPRLAASRYISFSEGRELSLQTVVNNINAGKPVLCGISPANRAYYRDSEHAVMITGYEIGPNGYYLVVNDPYPYQRDNPWFRNGGRLRPDNKYLIPYSNFVNGMCWNWSASNIRL